ncbi:MAG: DUF362 domain-containing protein, partial [Gemmataceae bacterium]|nr:DUF362 domain-containing protein [Gemmataceae bacterium]
KAHASFIAAVKKNEDKLGGVVLGGYLWPNQYIISRKPVRSPADFKGLKGGEAIRVVLRGTFRSVHGGNRGAGGAEHAVEAWRRFFQPGDVVGIKVNPVGYQRQRGVVGAISSPAVLLEVVAGLKSAGVKARDIIVFERYASEFREAGYEAVMRERALDGVRWYASSTTGGNVQVDIEGYDGRRERDAHVVGYDPDVFVHMGFATPEHDPKDDRRFRSHLSVIITRLVNKFVTIPVLKDHRSAGVTLALKNLSHGLNNNVARSHLSGMQYGGMASPRRASGPNQCNTFIPTAVSQPAIRQKATLHILDGLIGVYEGGPGSWNRTWATWQHKGLFFATDPVALDHVGWDILDRKRAQEGWQPVAQMGLLHAVPAAMLSSGLAALAARGATEAVTLSAAGQNYRGGRDTEVFNRRQPEHVILAQTIGLGVFDARRIEHRRIELSA